MKPQQKKTVRDEFADDAPLGKSFGSWEAAGKGEGSQNQASKYMYTERDDIEDEKHSKVPWSDVLPLKGHEKTVCSLDFEPSGSRMVTVASDYKMKLWDFNGMDGSFQAFRTIEPREAHNNRWCRYSRKGGQILVAPGGNQAKIYDRNGEELLEFGKGDPYLVQMRATKGHVATLNCCEWNPADKERLITCSSDCTIRIWNVNVGNRHESILVGPKTASKKLGYSVCQYSRDSNLILGALSDGMLQIWDSKGSLKRPESAVMNLKGIECNSVDFDSENNSVILRAGNTLSLYDLRSFQEPIHVWKNLSEGPTSCLFSPDQTMILTADKSTLKLFSRTTFSLVENLEMKETIFGISWNSKINQIACGLKSGIVKLVNN